MVSPPERKVEPFAHHAQAGGARQDSSSRKERAKASRRGAAPPGGQQRLNLPQLGSIWCGMAWTSGIWLSQERRILGQLAFGRGRLSCRSMGQREGEDSAVARQRGPRKHCFVSMRGNDSKNESRLKSYGRFLNRFIPPQCRKAVLRSFLRRLRIQFAARQFVPGRGESEEHPSLRLSPRSRGARVKYSRVQSVSKRDATARLK